MHSSNQVTYLKIQQFLKRTLTHQGPPSARNALSHLKDGKMR